jgi:hypothetical protein
MRDFVELINVLNELKFSSESHKNIIFDNL